MGQPTNRVPRAGSQFKVAIFNSPTESLEILAVVFGMHAHANWVDVFPLAMKAKVRHACLGLGADKETVRSRQYFFGLDVDETWTKTNLRGR